MDQFEQTQKVVFDEPEFERRTQASRDSSSSITVWVMEHSKGLIQTEKGAQYVLVGFVVIAIILSAIFMKGPDKEGAPYTPGNHAKMTSQL